MPASPLPPSRPAALARRALALSVAFALFGTGAAMAQLDDENVLDAVEMARDGAALEHFLDEAGFGAAWRSATEIGPYARAVRISAVDPETSAVVDLIEGIGELERAEEDRLETTADLLEAADAIDRAVVTEQDAVVARNIARHELNVVNALLRIVAVDLFEVAYDADDQLLALDAPTLNQAHRTREITESTVQEMIQRKRDAEALLERREQELEDAIASRIRREDRHAELVVEQADLTAHRTRLDQAVRDLIVTGASEWVLTEVEGVSFMTPRALDAYIGAEQAAVEEFPNCYISWATVAAVSAVEGRHGTHGRARLQPDGTSEPRIVGIALDGETLDNYGNEVANIADSDGGLYDGDPVLDRAVGPMQFIPQTWQRWGRDGDGDGEIDPHDLDDAAAGAAAYLCQYGSLRSWENWNSAIHGYNHSNAYVASVKGNLDRMARVRLAFPADQPELLPRVPAGAYVEPPPEPEPELPEGEVPEGEAPEGELPEGEAPPEGQPATEAPAEVPAEPAPAPPDATTDTGSG